MNENEKNETAVEGQPIDNTPVVNAAVGAPASATLDVVDGESTWDKDSFVPPNEDDMPKEGPGSPGYDVYAPENDKFERPWLVQDGDTGAGETDDEEYTPKHVAPEAPAASDDVTVVEGPGEKDDA